MKINTHNLLSGLPTALGGVWAIDSTIGAHALAKLMADGRPEAADDQPVAFAASPAMVNPLLLAGPDGVAVVMVRGVLVNFGPAYDDWYGCTNTLAITDAVNTAAADPKINAIVLAINSPGGMVAGNLACGEAIAAANAVKPVTAVCMGLCASAAYWLASQASEVVADSKTDLIGSIGAVMTLYDYSSYLEKAGIKAEQFKTGTIKGAGTFGTAITDEQRAYFQDIIDKSQAFFSAAVAAGRKMPIAKVTPHAKDTLATGGVFIAQDAIKNGLIDRIASFDSTLAALAAAPPPSTQGNSAMSKENPTAPVAATIAELEAACPGADAQFLVESSKKGMTVAQAVVHYAGTLAAKLENRETEIKAKDAEITTLKATVATLEKAAADAGAGVPPLGSNHNGTGGATVATQWKELVAKHTAKGLSRADALAAAVKEDPALHAAFIAAPVKAAE